MRNFKHMVIIGGLALAGVATAGALRAFPNTLSWAEDPATGIHCGAGDIWATGGVKDWGITCAMCHVNDVNQQGQITAQLTWNPPLSGGKYAPGTDYTVTMKLLGEHLAVNNASNTNGFTMTFEDVNGNPKGKLLGDMQTSCPSTPNTLPDGALQGTTFTYSVPANGNQCRSIASLSRKNVSTWSFKWTSPAAGSGTVYAYYGLIDGNGDTKSFGDDVKMGKVQMPEGP
ncbi:MAG: hypothetical protein QM820_44720 [Minicystis sp.]